MSALLQEIGAAVQEGQGSFETVISTLKNRWEWVVFFENWVGVDVFVKK